MRILLCPSTNGFGHIRRLIALQRGLVSLGHKADFLVTDKATLRQRQMIQKESGALLIVDSSIHPDSFFIEGPYTGQTKEVCIPNLSSFKHLEYDYVVADTITWPASLNAPSLFIGQFTWQMYFDNSSPDSSLDSFRRIMGIDLFAWSELKVHSKFVPLPLIDYWNLSTRSILFCDKIGIANNGVNQFFLSSEIGEELIPISGIPEFLNSHGWLPKYMVMRPGIGNLMEALSARVVPILTSDFDCDVRYNKQVLLDAHYALDASEVNFHEQETTLEHRPYDGPIISQLEFAEVVIREMC
jgi:hypothetical protein